MSKRSNKSYSKPEPKGQLMDNKDVAEESKSVVPGEISSQEQADKLAATYEGLKGKYIYVVSDKNVFENDKEVYAQKYAARKGLVVFKCNNKE